MISASLGERVEAAVSSALRAALRDPTTAEARRALGIAGLHPTNASAHGRTLVYAESANFVLD